MVLVIDIDAIKDASKKEWSIHTLEEYNNELHEEEIEIEKGNFTTNSALNKESKSWWRFGRPELNAH